MSEEVGPLRVFILGVVFLCALGVLTMRLWYVQIARGEEYTAKIRGRSQVTVRIPAVRGEILDRNGVKLVENGASFDVDFDLPELVRAYRKEHGQPPLTKYRGTVHGMPKEIKIEDVEEIVEKMVVPRLKQLNLAVDYNSKKMQLHYQRQAQIPFNYMQDINYETMVRLQENNIGLPGVGVNVTANRYYPYKALASHILGYTGMPNDINTAEAKKFNYYQPDMEGRSQIELTMNDFLKGTAGVSIRERDVKGNVTGEVKRIAPKQGANVYLTIDARLQYLAEKALRSVGRGAVAVVDPNNGDILALASVPSFDPNIFIPSIKASDWKALKADEADPLVNRAISGYAPGSTYKVPVALAGQRAGATKKSFVCSGGVQYGAFFMKCHHVHGSVDMQQALKVSCNSYFYQMGNVAGIDQIVAVGNMLGLGQKTGIPLSGEASGVLPSKEWLAKFYPEHRWSSGYTANTSIGQGFVLVSPLQMASIAATVANGGTSYVPQLIEKVVDQDGKMVWEPEPIVRADLLADGGLTAQQVEQVRKGMWKVVNESGGTGSRARIKGMEVAGKTGTAQFMRGKVKDNRVWFMAFGPYQNPKFAICVMVEGGHAGGVVAAPIAGKILEDAMKLDDGGALADMKIEPLEPAKGNFKHVASIDFGRPIPAATEAVAPASTTDSVDAVGGNVPAIEGQAAKPTGVPNIRAEADERGKVKNNRNPISKFFDSFRKKKKENPE